MKLLSNYIFGLSLFLIFAACTDDNIIEDPVDDEKVTDCAICTIPDFETDSEDSLTRSISTFTGKDFAFSWEDEGEIITVYGDAGNKGDFTLISSNGKSAKFTGGGFSLTAGKEYYSLSKSKTGYGTNQALHNIPLINGTYNDFNADSYTNIKMSYDGQRQTVNEVKSGNETDGYTYNPEATAHLGKYDYMTAVASANENNSCDFQFKRLGVILRIVIKGLPAGVAYKQLTMYDASEDEFREMDRATNITNSSSASYDPYYNTVTLDDDSPRFSIMLGGTLTTDKNGVEPGGEGYIDTYSENGLSVGDGESLIVYMMIPPVDLSGRTIAFHLYPVDSTKKGYFCSKARQSPLVANTAVQMTMTAAQCTQYNINVKVQTDWNKGNTVKQTRSTGDPGVTESFAKPKYLYAFLVNAGKLVATASAEGTVTDGVAEGILESNWTESDGMYSYTGGWKNTLDGSEVNDLTSLALDASNTTNPRVYIVASPSRITEWKKDDGTVVSLAYGSTNGTEESVIQGFTYNYADMDIKNLYATAYVNSKSFTGTLGDDVRDVILTHVCSKLDVNWESASALSGSVTVNNFPTTNLSFFKPTSTEYTTGLTGTASTAITTGTAYNGRAVFYVPQPSDATYSVKIGSADAQNITFTPDATYTSWFRGLVTVK